MVGDLLQEERSEAYKKSVKLDYESFRDKFLSRGRKKSYLNLEQARANHLQIDWRQEDITVPRQLGVQETGLVDLRKLEPFIDWSPFFRAWDLHGKFPEILEDALVGEQARSLYRDARKMLRDITRRKQMERYLSRSDRLVSLGTLAAGVAHEINNPSAVILLNMPIIKYSPHKPSPELDRFLVKINIDYPSTDDEVLIATRYARQSFAETAASGSQLLDVCAAQAQCAAIEIDAQVLRVDLARGRPAALPGRDPGAGEAARR